MPRSRRPLAASARASGARAAAALGLAAACGAAGLPTQCREGERPPAPGPGSPGLAAGQRVVAFAVAPHEVGTNLPPWAACWFPHRANLQAAGRPR